MSLRGVVEVAEGSKMLLEGVCEEKALGDCIGELERMFGEGKIGLEGLMKGVRKLEEDRFMARWIVRRAMATEGGKR